MRTLGLLASAAAAAAALPFVPTVSVCNAFEPTACVDMPQLQTGSCCGTYNISSYLAAGGRAIDTSVDYGSQPFIAAAIAAANIPRDQLWITSKLNVESIAADMSGALTSLVLQPLNTSYVDLLLLHHAGRMENDRNPRPACWNASAAGPTGPGSYAACRVIAVQAMEKLRKAGLIRAWGVSNFVPRDLLQIKAALGVFPPVNQIEFHPYYVDRETVSFCNRNGIKVTAYAPMGDGTRSGMLNNTLWPALGAAHGLTPEESLQIPMVWELATGADIVIPRSANPAHQAQNLALFDQTARDGSTAVQLSEFELANVSSVGPYKKIYATECQPWC